jgi:2-polyprenyl-6-methoxyphenol hydroxylase-like FAD-dependent oxidoreductase
MRAVDLVVVGGGPAGASLAIAAGRAGLSVDLLEARHHPRDKACGEGIMPSGVRALARLGFSDGCGGQRYWGVRYRGFGVDVVADFPADAGAPATAPFGLGQRRTVLDRALVEVARATPGVRVFEDCPVDGLELGWGRVVGVRAGERRFRGRLTVGADGVQSTVRRLLGLGLEPDSGQASHEGQEDRAGAPGHARARQARHARHARIGWRMHFRLAPGREPSPHVEVHVGRDHEIYVTPLPEGQVLVAALAGQGAVQGDAEATLRRWIALHPALRESLAGAEALSPARGRYPLVRGARAGVAPGAILLGDAAGNSDPITGGGISQALLSAELLASQLPAALRGPDSHYDGEWLQEFDRRRRALLRDYRWLTAGLVEVARVPMLARAMLHAMRARPAIMRHMVGVAAGLRPLAGLRQPTG